MTPDSSPFVNQIRLEFSFLVSSSPLPYVLAQPHLRASPNTIAASFLLSSSSFRTFILLHGSLINSAWLLLGFLTFEDGLINKRGNKLRGCSWFSKFFVWQSWTWLQSFFSKENQVVLWFFFQKVSQMTCHSFPTTTICQKVMLLRTVMLENMMFLKEL